MFPTTVQDQCTIFLEPISFRAAGNYIYILCMKEHVREESPNFFAFVGTIDQHTVCVNRVEVLAGIEVVVHKEGQLEHEK